VVEVVTAKWTGESDLTLGPAVVDRLADRMAHAVLAAQADLHPCELATAAVQVDARLIRNRTLKSDSANRWGCIGYSQK